VVALSTVRGRGVSPPRAPRARGRASVQLYVAFDDPYSAVATIGLTSASRPARAVAGRAGCVEEMEPSAGGSPRRRARQSAA